jgi:hypothetical protein
MTAGKFIYLECNVVMDLEGNTNKHKQMAALQGISRETQKKKQSQECLFYFIISKRNVY